MSIHILSDRIKSGKTSQVISWAGPRNDVGGILAPDIEETRTVFSIRDNLAFPLQVTGNCSPEKTWSLGRFVFFKAAFQEARRALIRSFLDKPNWLIIDEIGPLELAGRGLEPTVGRIIRWYQGNPDSGHLLLLIRSSLLEKVLRTYRILDWHRFNPVRDHGLEKCSC